MVLSALLAGLAVLPTQPCRVLIVAKHASEAVYLEDVAEGPCPAQPSSPKLRYDVRTRLVTARFDLAEGTLLGLAYLPKRPAVAAGETVQITAAVRHVVVSRQAVAVQSAQAGQRFFVRTEDGRLLVAPPVAKRPSDRRAKP